jgi:hypothetical protein
MWTLRHSPYRLRVVLLKSRAQIDFDRRRNKAEILPFSWSASFTPISAPLSEIADARVRKCETSGESAHYTLVLRTRMGEKLTFDCGSRGDAMDAMRAISRFLQCEHDVGRFMSSQDRTG